VCIYVEKKSYVTLFLLIHALKMLGVLELLESRFADV